MQDLAGDYIAAAILTCGGFVGSALWWVGLFVGLTTFRGRFNLRVLGWIQRLSGALIAGFGFAVLLSLSPVAAMFEMSF